MLHYAKWKYILLVVFLGLGAIFSAPNFLPKMDQENLPTWLKPVNLGLDLQGGSQLLLEVQVDAVIKEQLQAMVQSIRTILRGKKVYSKVSLENNEITFSVKDVNKINSIIAEVKKLDREALNVVNDGDKVTVTFTEIALNMMQRRAVEQSIEIVRKRVDQLGTKEPTIQAQGQDRIILQIPGLEDPEAVKKLLGKTAKMSFHFVDDKTSLADARKGKLPSTSFVAMSMEGGQLVLERDIVVGGDRLVDAAISFQEGGMPAVSFRFDSLGSRKFGMATSKNVGRRLAIVLDNQVISAPTVQSAITGGSGIITGQFSAESATELAMLLRSGALPAPLVVLEERTVGPGLGTDSIEAGTQACLIALVLIIFSMVFFYGRFGMIASLALIFNLILIIGILSMLQATLTLPGIAGIALTLAMAVDANILIYERMRDEKRAGRTPANMIEVGFGNAIRAILDSNITTFAAGLILFYFGSGPVKGFGVTLMIGIFTTLISAVLGTRALITLWYNRKKPETINI